MNTTFSLQRVKLLLMRYFVENWKINVFFLVPIFILGLLSVAMPIYVIVLCIFTGTYFYNFSKTEQNTHYFLIPASTFEKFTVNLFLIYIYLTFLFVLTLFFGVLFKEILSFIIYNKNMNLLNVSSVYFSQFNVNQMLFIFVIQSILMFGSIYFKKNALLKTIISIFSTLLMMGIVFIITIYVNIDHSTNLLFTVDNINMKSPHILWIKEYIPFIFSFIIISFFWVLSYLRLRESEV